MGRVNQTDALRELGRRLSARLKEARLSVEALADRAGVPVEELELFKQGEAALGASAVNRLAQALGVPAAGLMSIEAPEVRAWVDPQVLLLSSGLANLGVRDQERIAWALKRARSFVELRTLLRRDSAPLGRQSPAPEVDPYRDGYAAARDARGAVDDPRGPVRDLSRLIEDRFGILVVRFRFETPHVFAAAVRSGNARVIVIDSGQSGLGTQRRSLAHELGHHLRDLGEDGAIVEEVVEGDYTHEKPAEERRADAFAIMFLAPEDGLTELLGPPRGGTDVSEARHLVDRVRERFGIGFEAAAWHLANLGYFVRDIAMALLPAPIGKPLSGFEEHALPDGVERLLREAEAADLLSAGMRRNLLGTSVFEDGLP